jgi:kinesin family protein 6/9
MKAGNEANEALIAKKTSLVQVKARARTLRTDLNRLKAQIDEYKALLAQKRSSTRAIDASKTTDEDEVVDAEEFDLMKREQAAKREYRANFAQLKQYRMDIDQYTREAAQMRGVLVQNFNDWYATATGEDLEDPTKNTKNDDRMDEGEMFEKMEIDRVMEEDPDSVSFFLAQKNLDKTRRKDHGRTARSIRSKRLHK